ncbi:Fur family transcriptional regulator [Amycolatopsis sp. NPDC049253]|uniref:Fur family transcriptional regulator n=1 Tax=Amycolatopsis sp. NPDC049253 TaxID=3155274 RepID=UPI00343CF14D
MPATDPAERLRGVSLRVTKQRTAVLHAVAQRPHADVETVVRAVRSELGAVSTQAVYDILAALGEVGLVRRIEPAGSPARFEVRTGDNHHHVVCRRCGAVADVDCAVGERPCLAPASTNGFVIDEAEVTYWGLCPSCNEN